MKEIVAVTSTEVRETKQQGPAAKKIPKKRPCRMASQGCTGIHHLGECENFKQRPAGWKVEQLNKWQLCLFCFKHKPSNGCFAKAEEDYAGCGVYGCREHHHRDLHFTLTAANIFSVHAQPA